MLDKSAERKVERRVNAFRQSDPIVGKLGTVDPEKFHSPKLGLVSVGLTGEILRGLIAGLDRELETLLSDE